MGRPAPRRRRSAGWPRARRCRASGCPSAPRRASCRVRRATASAPSDTSPITVMSSSAFSSDRNPARTNAWSSTSTTLITGRHLERQDGLRRVVPPDRRRPDVERAAERVARSRMPRMPLPSRLRRGRPIPRRCRRPATVDRVVTVVDDDRRAVAPQCRTTLVIASWTIRYAASSTAAGSGRTSPVTLVRTSSPAWRAALDQVVEGGQGGAGRAGAASSSSRSTPTSERSSTGLPCWRP